MHIEQIIERLADGNKLRDAASLFNESWEDDYYEHGMRHESINDFAADIIRDGVVEQPTLIEKIEALLTDTLS